MDDGAPSATARRVAGYRLAFERLATPYGEPSADDRLASDVAGGTLADGNEWMARYLRGRTAFFDRVVVDAIGRDVSQIVVIGAGYDGRALRYGAPGVRWWEIDHPDTQADKRRRLGRLGIDDTAVAFVSFDLRDGGLAAALIGSGFTPDAPALFVCEGVAVYLDAAVLAAVLHELRALATPDTRLAISTSATRPDPERRAQLHAAVAAVGEPARSTWTAEATAALLAGAGWRAVEVSEAAQRAGFVMAAPV